MQYTLTIFAQDGRRNEGQRNLEIIFLLVLLLNVCVKEHLEINVPVPVAARSKA